MAKSAALPFQGSPSHTQGFGARPSVYAKYGLNGHDGDDWVMPEGTPLYSPVDGVVLRHGEDPLGWGKYIQIWDSNQRLLINIAHTSGLTAISGARVSRGQQIAYSGNTGYSEAPHVHVAAADTDDQGNKSNTDNGFKGWYSILNLSTAPSTPTQTQPTQSSTSPAPQGGLTFERAYPVLYPGWDRAAAEANFRDTGGKDKAGYDQLVGNTTSAPTSSGGLGRAPTFEEAYPALYGGWDRAAAEANFRDTGGKDKAGYDELVTGKKKIPADPFDIEENSHAYEIGNWYIKNAHAGKSFRQIQAGGVVLGDIDKLAGYFMQTPDTLWMWGAPVTASGFPSKEIPNSPEWKGFARIFARTWEPRNAKPATPAPTTTPTNPVMNPTTLTITNGQTQNTTPASQLDRIEQKLDQVLARFGTGANLATTTPATPAPILGGFGYIYVTTSPTNASVYIDGQFVKDYTPMNTPLQIVTGNHNLEVKKKGYKTIKEQVTVGLSEQVTKHYNLEDSA